MFTPACKNPGLVNGKIFPDPQRLGVQGPKIVTLPRYSLISDSPFKEQSLMAFPGTLPIILDTGGLGALCPNTSGHNSRRNMLPSLDFSSELQPGASCPVNATPASRALALEEITLQQSSHTHRCTRVFLLTPECMGGSCVCLGGLNILSRFSCLSKMPHNTGTRMEKRILGFSSTPTPSTSQPRKHL